MRQNAVNPILPTRLYGTTIVSLAVFFAGLIAWRVPVEGYLAVSQIGRHVLAQPDQNDHLVNAVQILDDPQIPALHQVLADAIRFADARLANAQPDLQAEVSEQRIRSAQDRLTINVRSLPECEHTICISFAGSDPAWSLALVEHLTRDCLLAPSQNPATQTRSARALRDAQWRLDQTRHYERKARYRVEDTVDAYFAMLARPGKHGEEVESLSENTLGSRLLAGPDTAPQLNPKWEALQGQLDAMSEQLRPLVEHLTPAHPHILELTRRMDLVRAELEATPQYLGADASEAGARAGSESAAQASHVAGVVGSYLEDYQELRKAYQEAIGDREEAERRLSSLLVRSADESSSPPGESRWLITPPTLQGRIGGRPSAHRVGAIGLLALCCGAGTAWLITTLGGLRRIYTVAELEQILSVPVVGQLSIDPAPRSVVRLAARCRIARGLVKGAEIALGLMLVVFISGAIAGSPASQLLREDPFAAIPDTIIQALQSWL